MHPTPDQDAKATVGLDHHWADPAAIVSFDDGDPEEDPWVNGPPAPAEIRIEAHSPNWADDFEMCKGLIAGALPDIALRIEHIGSTAVPGLPAKPVIDIDLIVADPTQEARYVPGLAPLGYVLTVRERTWYQHRMLSLHAPRVHLHVFGPGCPEHIRHLLFRDWLRDHPNDRQRYAMAKLAAKVGVTSGRDYNRNKEAVVRDIYRGIFVHHGWIGAS